MAITSSISHVKTLSIAKDTSLTKRCPCAEGEEDESLQFSFQILIPQLNTKSGSFHTLLAIIVQSAVGGQIFCSLWLCCMQYFLVGGIPGSNCTKHFLVLRLHCSFPTLHSSPMPWQHNPPSGFHVCSDHWCSDVWAPPHIELCYFLHCFMLPTLLTYPFLELCVEIPPLNGDTFKVISRSWVKEICPQTWYEWATSICS